MTALNELRSYLALCMRKIAEPLPAHHIRQGAYVYPFTRDEWINEAKMTQEKIDAWEEMETV